MALAVPSAWNHCSFFPNWQTLWCLLRPTSIPPLPWHFLKTRARLLQTRSLLTSLCTHCTFYFSPLLFLFMCVNNCKLFQHFSWASHYSMHNWWIWKRNSQSEYKWAIKETLYSRVLKSEWKQNPPSAIHFFLSLSRLYLSIHV